MMKNRRDERGESRDAAVGSPRYGCDALQLGDAEVSRYGPTTLPRQ